MIKQLLIGGSIAAAAGYSIPGVPKMLNFTSSNSFQTSGAKWEIAKFRVGNISFTSMFNEPKVTRGGTGGNSISAIVDASNAELARKNGTGGAKFIKN
jgi:hypothetical protein